MVDKDEILRLLKKNFSYAGPVDISDDGVVSLERSIVNLNYSFRTLEGKVISRLPIKFGEVKGNFEVRRSGLRSLEGCPHTVGGNFRCGRNPIKSFKGGPTKVDRSYHADYCPSLRRLDGAPNEINDEFSVYNSGIFSFVGGPQKIGFLEASFCSSLLSLEGLAAQVNHISISYNRHLPLLRLLNAKKLNFVPHDGVSKEVYEIMEPYLGQGEAGAFECGAQLASAGYKENARW